MTKPIKCDDCFYFESFGWQGLDHGYCKLDIRPKGEMCQRGQREHPCEKFAPKQTENDPL